MKGTIRRIRLTNSVLTPAGSRTYLLQAKTSAKK
jgi:hypothetical protein